MSLCPEDMAKEVDSIMTEVAALVQAEVESAEVAAAEREAFGPGAEARHLIIS